MKRSTFGFLILAMILALAPASAGSAYAASASASIRVSCTILPILQVSSQSIANPQNNSQNMTTQTLRETPQGLFQVTSVTAL